MKSPRIRLGRKGDVDKFYEGREKPKRTMRVMVAELDDEILAIAGIVYHKNLIEIFSDMKEKMREYPVSIWKGAKAVMEFVSGYNLPVHAIANSCYPEAEEFLSRLGFVFVEETEQGRLYKWNTSQKS